LPDETLISKIAKNESNNSTVRLKAALALNNKTVLNEIQNGKLNEQDIVDESVTRLVHLYGLSPRGEGFFVGSGSDEFVKNIGEILNAAGGKQLMLAVHQQFAAIYNIMGAARNLEMIWDGIGEWQG